MSFYQRKEIKDILAYLRLVVNPNDEESLKRVINYPARGIGATTVDKLVVASKGHNISLLDVLSQIDKLDLKINSSTTNKLKNFEQMIQRFRIENEKMNAFEITDFIIKKTGIVNELKKDGTPEGIARIENIEELLNGIRDFTEGQIEIVDAKADLAEFLADVALLTDMDQEEEENADRVSLMTIHLAKGLEFSNVFVVGLEEDLFPSALSLSTRLELEEERRLFYVALTRAKKQAFLTYTQSRYRWGKLIDAEPSRFIEELDKEFIELPPKEAPYTFKPLLNDSIFGEPVSTTKSVERKLPKDGPINTSPTPSQLQKLRAIDTAPKPVGEMDVLLLAIGDEVLHERFGLGKVISLEGKGADQKAAIDFKGVGVKKLLLRFAQLKKV